MKSQTARCTGTVERVQEMEEERKRREEGKKKKPQGLIGSSSFQCNCVLSGESPSRVIKIRGD